MLRRTSELRDYKLGAIDGEIGKVIEFYFDDQSWTIRYLVAETGGWLSLRQVLISPYALGPAKEDAHIIPVDLTREQIEKSPSFNSDRPVSRQYERDFFDYYGYPEYWVGPHMWGAQPALAYPLPAPRPPAEHKGEWDPHLRSTRAVTGYHVAAKNGLAGHVEDFIIDDANWTIRYLVVDTHNWWPGRRVLLSPHWITDVSWTDSLVSTEITKEAISGSPAFNAASLLTRGYEEILHRHYNLKGYWVDERPARTHAVK